MDKAGGRRSAASRQVHQGAFGRLVRVFRERAGLTQVQVAARLGVSQAAVAQIERGQASPSLELADALARVLHTTVDELLGGPPGARVVHYHVPGEVQVTVSNPGLVVFGKLAREELDAWVAAWQQMRAAPPAPGDLQPRRNCPPGSAGN
jgi:transcriptional regulator with XRE-family HTH domain